MSGWLPRSAFLVLPLALGLGCSHARLVEINADGSGVVAIPDDTNTWPSRNRAHAEELMAQRCPQGYVIDHEGEVVMGQIEHTDVKTDQHGKSLATSLGLAPVRTDTHETTSYVDQKEWRIWFRPKNGPPAGATPGNLESSESAGSDSPRQ